MTHFGKAVLLSVLSSTCALTLPAYAEDQLAADSIAGQLIPNRYIVVLDRNSVLDAGGVPTLAQQLGDLYGGRILSQLEHALQGFVVELPDISAAWLALDPRVAYLEQDQVVTATGGIQNPATWGLDRIDQSDLPLDGQYQYLHDGTTVHSYIIDTGIRTSHSEFSGRSGNGRNFVSTTGLLFGSGNADPEDTDDCNGHGTHVAGTIAGTTWGVAKAAVVHPVRVLDCNGSGANSSVIEGVDWVMANHQKPAVANMSLGGGNSTALDQAVRNAINAGVSFVVAAGNDNTDACDGSPNRVAEAITVGSTTASDGRSSFSNKGSCVDIFAPGSSITSAGISNDQDTATMSGTSMAAPHVAGVAALYLDANPGAAPGEVFQAVLNSSVSDRLSGIGSGSPNLLLQASVTGSGGDDTPPVATFSADCNARHCSFDASGSRDDQGISAYQWDFGDGSSNSVAQTSHSYGQDGSYTVTLTVTDTVGQTGYSNQQIEVSENSAPCDNCQHSSGQLSDGQTLYGDSFSSGGGQFEGWLTGPTGSNFDLSLEKQSCFIFCSWSTVAQSTGTDSSEHVDYVGNSGTYRWRLNSSSGSGTYDFWRRNP